MFVPLFVRNMIGEMRIMEDCVFSVSEMSLLILMRSCCWLQHHSWIPAPASLLSHSQQLLYS